MSDSNQNTNTTSNTTSNTSMNTKPAKPVPAPLQSINESFSAEKKERKIKKGNNS